FSPDGRSLVSAGADQSIQFWEPATGKLQNKLAQDKVLNFKTLSCSPDGKLLALGNQQGHVLLVDAPAAKLRHQLKAHALGSTTVEIAPAGKTLASAGEDGWVGMWDINTGNQVRTVLQEGHRGLLPLRFSPDGNRLAPGSWRGVVPVFDVPAGKE